MCGNPFSFEEWLDELNAEAARRDYAGADRFWQGTGSDCWLPYYEDGYTPADALTEDESNA
jgi:hypothetical protein